METVKINPDFSNLENPGTIIKSIHDMKSSTREPVGRSEALEQLLEQVEPVDFIAKKYPDVVRLRKQLEGLEPGSDTANKIQKQIGSLKLKRDDYVFDTIKSTLELAEKNGWGLCLNSGSIYLYNGAFWDMLDSAQFKMFLCDIAEGMGLPEREARFHRFQDELIRQFEASASLPTPEPEPDKVLINLKNGTYEVNGDGKTNLRPPSKEDFLTYQLPFDYDPKAAAPRFQKYLNEVLPDIERQMVLAEYIGYLFVRHGTNNLKLEKLLILYGGGQNGKSVFLDIIGALIGSNNITNISLENLTEPKGFYRVGLNNRLVNYSTEINGKFDVSLFKKLVSGEPVEACQKYEQPFTMTQYAKFIFNSNELPQSVEHSDAYFRRFLIVPFDVKITEEQKDVDLAGKIIDSELSGVFNWVLEGLSRLIAQRKFSPCEASENVLKKYRLETNSVQMFLEDNNYKASENGRYIKLNELFQEYQTYCVGEGRRPFNKTNFREQMRKLGVVDDRNRDGNIYYLEGGINPFEAPY
ncbi:phage/plasmid primase, P4 family [Proteiniphilum saccharofermentans]|uniref:DNA primase family protein n=1 Tax=Proteiniphilum saccharofermentans TaxID=1642647 RepID=UPI0028AE395B|nr:phage/plasmid primase, P4 family [Proteiniphilum saccharofermentans]